MGVMGIDVSHEHGGIDWSVVARGDIAFVILRATEGMTFEDPSFGGHWRALGAAGVARGAYHAARPSRNAADEEADHFLARVEAAGGLRAGDLLALRMEDPHASGDLHDWTLAWLEHVETRVRFKPLVYAEGPYLRLHGLVGSDDLARYPLWYAMNTYRAGCVPTPPCRWRGVVLHHYSDRGSVAGIGDGVDLDWFTGDTIDDLRAQGAP